MGLTEMLSNRIKCHRATMGILSAIHLAFTCILVICLLDQPYEKTARCTFLHYLASAIYAGLNGMMTLYYFHLYKYARTQSMDIFIFEIQKRLVAYGMLVSFAILVEHAVCNVYVCRLEPISKALTIIRWLHVFLECLSLRIYFGWHQEELTKYSGGQSEVMKSNSSTAQNTDTFNN